MSKEHSYAYEAGYRDGAINYELDHCPACKNVADLQEALDERDQLRELVRDMWDFYCAELGEPRVFEEELDFSVEVWKRMRKLGVEVDG